MTGQLRLRLGSYAMKLWCRIVDHRWVINFEESYCRRCGAEARDLWWWPK